MVVEVVGVDVAVVEVVEVGAVVVHTHREAAESRHSENRSTPLGALVLNRMRCGKIARRHIWDFLSTKWIAQTPTWRKMQLH